jgi:PAS domain S-box-containing protein
MKVHFAQRTLIRYIVITCIGIVLIVSADYLGFFKGINDYLYDLSFRVRGPLEHDKRIIIVAIDEKSLEKLGRWPLRRIYYAKLLDSVNQAKVAAFDIIMAEPSEDDAVFEDAIKRHGRVIMPVYIDSRLNISYPRIAISPHDIGHIHVEQGIDGIVRKVFHTLYVHDVTLPSFTSVIYETFTGKILKRENTLAIVQSNSGSNKILQADSVNINFYGHSGTFQYISMSDIIDGYYPQPYFKDKIILVGLTTAGLEDKMLTPFTQKRDRMSGVEVHANILNNLIDNNNISEVPDFLQWFLAAVLSSICFLLFIHLNERKVTAVWLLCLIGTTLSVFALFIVFRLWLSPVIFYVSVSFVYLTTYVYRLERIGKLLFFAKEEWENTFNDINDAIIVHDKDFNIVRSNKAAEEILKRPFFEKIKTQWNAKAHESENSQEYPTLKLLETGKPVTTEIFESDLNRFIEVKSIPRFDKKYHIAGAIHLIRDITKRKQAEEKIKTHLEYLQALRNIDMAITSSLDLRITLNVFLEEVMSQLHVDAAAVLLLNPHTKTLEYALGKGFRKEYITHTAIKLGEGYAGRVALEREPLIVPDISVLKHDDMHALFFEQENIQSYFGMPLIAKGHVNGVFEIFHRTPSEPTSEWLDFLESLTRQAAIAIDNAVMFVDLERSRDEIIIAYDATIEGWSRALDFRDKETEWHSRRVAEMTVRIARELQLSEEELVHLRRGALLHDIGKLGVPDYILLKPGNLNEEEWKIMKRHPQIAYEILSPITFLQPALDIPYCHHEKWDGTGYPRGLKGEKIPLAARIFAIVDIWDALCSDRPNRAGWPKGDVRKHIRSLAGTHLDPDLVNVFLGMEW